MKNWSPHLDFPKLLGKNCQTIVVILLLKKTVLDLLQMCTVTLRITTIPCRLYLQQADGVWEGRGGGRGLKQSLGVMWCWMWTINDIIAGNGRVLKWLIVKKLCHYLRFSKMSFVELWVSFFAKLVISEMPYKVLYLSLQHFC